MFPGSPAKIDFITRAMDGKKDEKAFQAEAT